MTKDYADLIAFDINKVSTPVTLKESEALILYELEEITEKMKSESKKVEKESSAVTIASFDF